ncbi:MAG: ROK family protein [Sedimentisphaerales bacterium]|nr:ROK family protein [Sedimentisphaerales bacterium]
MIQINHDERVVLTLDAGGTNFVFSAMKDGKQVSEDIRLPAYADNLDKSLDALVQGFQRVIDSLETRPVAISFAFPGPADYPNGIIDNMVNLPAYAGGVALGPFLENHFQMPVFINNDGDLFVYGEAIAGLLPKVNQQLEQAGSPKRFHHLFGITLGTGFGAGIVSHGQLYRGDNSAAGEIWIVRNKRYPKCFAEEGASIRAVRSSYARCAGLNVEKAPSPQDIYEIASGRQTGNKQAAITAFEELGEVVGDALANAMTLMDGLVVIGGGLAGAYSCFIGKILEQMNGTLEKYNGEKIPRMIQRCFDLDDESSLATFIAGRVKEIQIPRSEKMMNYDSLKRIGVGRSVLGTSQAVAVGAYAYALHEMS